MSVVELEDDDAIASLLENDRVWSAYAFCDLDQPYRAHARFFGISGGRLDGLVLFYELDRFTAIVPCGFVSAVLATLENAQNIPQTVFLNVQNVHLDAVDKRYRILDRWQMLRMSVESDCLRPAREIDMEISPLTAAHAGEIEGLYSGNDDAVFEASMLKEGFYRGVRDGGRLVAVAGTHAVSRRFGIATIGGVLTLPEYRGRGLAGAATAAVGTALRDAGIRTLALNVRETNLPAIAAYTRLGFDTHCPFWEGHAVLREVSA